MSAQADILRSNMRACAQRIDKLRESLDKTRDLFPLTLAKATALTDDQQESVDALILRYSQCVSMIQDQIFRGIAYLEQEDIGDKSNRDKALLMEKLGAIQSAEAFGTAAILRNKLSHHYPDESLQRVERLNLITAEGEYLTAAFAMIGQYLARKGFV